MSEHRRADRAWQERFAVGVARVSVGDASAHPAALTHAPLKPCGDAVHDRGVLELGEHAEHLQHHPPRG